MKEIWKEIPFEVNYEVSNSGKVRNKETKHCKSFRENKGYLRVTLYPSGKTYSIHRLVMLTFEPEKSCLPHINHKDGDKKNNKVDNLEWVTVSDNVQHAFDTGLKSGLKGSRNGTSKITEDIAKKIKYNHPDLKNKAVAILYGLLSDESVRRIRKEILWKHI